MKISYISIAHIVVGLALLMWLQSTRFQPFQSNVHKGLIVAVGVGILLYHLNKYHSTQRWIYLFHVLVVAPTVIYFGLYPQDGRGKLQLIAVSMIAYHLAILLNVL